MMDIEIVDCVVLGGGPVGTTLAAIVKRHHPRATVVVLEPTHSASAPGADVREGTHVTAVRRVGKAALPVVTWEDDAGRRGRLLADFVLDATELACTLQHGERELADGLDDLAAVAYLRGAAPELVSESQASTSPATSACAAPAAR
jgi:hypothetical protein